MFISLAHFLDSRHSVLVFYYRRLRDKRRSSMNVPCLHKQTCFQHCKNIILGFDQGIKKFANVTIFSSNRCPGSLPDMQHLVLL